MSETGSGMGPETGKVPAQEVAVATAVEISTVPGSEAAVSGSTETPMPALGIDDEDGPDPRTEDEKPLPLSENAKALGIKETSGLVVDRVLINNPELPQIDRTTYRVLGAFEKAYASKSYYEANPSKNNEAKVQYLVKAGVAGELGKVLDELGANEHVSLVQKEWDEWKIKSAEADKK